MENHLGSNGCVPSIRLQHVAAKRMGRFGTRSSDHHCCLPRNGIGTTETLNVMVWKMPERTQPQISF